MANQAAAAYLSREIHFNQALLELLYKGEFDVLGEGEHALLISR